MRAPSRSIAQTLAEIRVGRRFGAPAKRVFDAWLDPAVAGRWLFATATRPMTHVEIDARVAGSFRFAERSEGRLTQHTGEYLEIIPPRLLAFTLALGNRAQFTTRVTVGITPVRTGCELELTHAGVPASRADHIEARWTGILYGLGVTLAASRDPSQPDKETHHG